MTAYLYLHGFASSPQSYKAQVLRRQFQTRSQNLHVPDLNEDDFLHLTLTRQIQRVQTMLPNEPQSAVVIGSSLGGLVAAWIGEKCPQVKQLVLLAPAFGFLDHWLPQVGRSQLHEWQQSGILPVYHYGYQAVRPLHYSFVTDCAFYREADLQHPVPTLILHGRYDEVIPVGASRAYAACRPWVTLIELDSDHGLSDVTEEIWSAIQDFCQDLVSR